MAVPVHRTPGPVDVPADGIAASDPLAGYLLEEQIGHLLRRAHQRHVALFQATFGEDGPTPTQYAALVRLHQHGALSQNQLGRMTAMDPATTKGVVARLMERGLVHRSPDPDDKRRIILRLTGEGASLVDDLVSKGRAATSATLAPLPPDAAADLVALLKRIC